MRVRDLTVLLIAFPVSFAAAAKDCTLAERYLQLARDRVQSVPTDDAQAFLRQSIAVWPSYEAYQQLGELAAQSSEPEDKAAAAEAFVSAHEIATTDTARARSLFHYAQLLNQDGDPQNAYPLIKTAARLDSASTEIAKLESIIEEQIRNPTTDQLRQSLKSQIFQPLRRATKAPASATVTMPIPSGRMLNIPINFVTGSTMVDDQTRPNLHTLAEALRDPALASNRFLFVGHADARGDEQRNMVLSQKRAEAIYREVLRVNPELQGRVDVSGRGETELIDLGNDEHAHRLNRRLQVMLK